MFNSKNFDLYFFLYETHPVAKHLCNELVWNWSEENGLWWIHNDASWQRCFRFAFQDDTFALSESIATFLVVGLNAGQEFIATLRGLDVFKTDVDALG